MNVVTNSFLSLLLLCSGHVLAQEQPDIKDPKTRGKPAFCFDTGVIIDPDIPLTHKRKDLASLEESVKSGDRHALYVAGTLYRLGDEHEAKVFSRDIQKAKAYLSNAAILGNYPAMAAMAEIEIKNKNYREAMLWAQVFAHYSELQRVESKSTSNQAYQAYLLQRIMQVTRKDRKLYTDKLFLDDLATFHSNFNKKILDAQSEEQFKADDLKYTACKDESTGKNKATLKIISGINIDASAKVSRQMSSPGYAYYYLTINAKGDVSKVLTIDSMPDASYAKAMTVLVKKIKFNESDGIEPRNAYVPLSFDDYSVAIKKSSAH